MRDDNNYWMRVGTRRIGRRRLLASTGVAGAGAAAAALVGCGDDDDAGDLASQVGGTQQPQVQAKRGGNFRATINAAPTNFDPHIAGTGNPARGNTIYSKLFRPKTGPGVPELSSEVINDASESHEVIDATTINVKLKGNLMFQPPVSRRATAQDMEFSYLRFTGQGAGSVQSTDSSQWKTFIESMKATDERTVAIKLKQAYGPYLNLLSGNYSAAIMPAAETGAGKAVDPTRTAVGTGPWILEQYVTNSLLRFRRHAEWFEGPERPYLDSHEQYIIPEYATRLTQFLGGNIDTLVNVPTGDIFRIRDGVRGALIGVGMTGDPVPLTMLSFSPQEPDGPWKDERVRRAMSMAIDRDAILDAAYDLKRLEAEGIKVRRVWNNFMAAAVEDHWLDPRGKDIDPRVAGYFKYDPEGAKKLLAEAGFPNGFRTKLHYTNIYSPSNLLNVELTAQYLGKVGVQAALTIDDYNAVYTPKTIRGDYDGLLIANYGSFVEPIEYFTQVYLPGALRNYSRMNDTVLNDRIQRIAANPDREARRKEILSLQNYLGEKMYYIPTQAGAGPVFTVYQPYVRGGIEYTTAGALNNVHYWLDK